MANRMLMVTIVSPIAISGETSAIVFDRSARFSSTSRIGRFLFRQGASAHQEAEILSARIRGRERLRQAAVEHDGNPVGDLDQFIKVLARDENSGATGREVDQCLADDRGGAGIHP